MSSGMTRDYLSCRAVLQQQPAMAGKSRRFRIGLRDERGGVMVEAAIVFPVLILLMLGIFQVAIYSTISTGTLSAALVGSQSLAAARGGTAIAANVGNAAVSALQASSIWKIAPKDITVKLYVDGALCSTCIGATASTSTCTGTCDTALTNAAPDPATAKYKMSSVSVQTNCSGITFAKSIPLACPITSQVYGVVQ